jgi:two-component system chemotaxis response regulator CheY
MKCLVVDESPSMRRIFRNALQALGCEEVLETADGTQAFERCDGSVGLVVADWDAPGIGGLELLKRLRVNVETATVKVLIVSTRNRRDDVLQAVEAGVDGYLLKPFAGEILKLKLESLMQAATDEGSRQAA